MTIREAQSGGHEVTLADFVTGDAPMRECLERARVAADTDLPVLILGESGTGKTILARAVHNSSRRARGPFVSFNAAALSDTLLDSQLFGHERGAFTGAHQRVKGKFELADRGTLFLDEIADLSGAGQSKILRAIEYGEFERLGSDMLRTADVRLLSATHYPLHALSRSGRFREDLFYRINGVMVTVPPLRLRPHDLPVLVASEIARASEKQGKTITGLDRSAADRLLAYHWPGNLRELSKVIQAAVALTRADVITADVLLLQHPSKEPVDVDAENTSAEKVPPAAASSLLLKDAVAAHVSYVLGLVKGNKRKAARELGIARATLERKLRET